MKKPSSKSAKNLQVLREFAGLSQWDLARELGCDRSKVSQFESGHIEPRPEELTTIMVTIRAAFRERVEKFERLAGEAA